MIAYSLKSSLAGFAIIAIFAGCSNSAIQSGSEDVEWRHYNGDVGGTKYSALGQINTSNVKDLELVWRYRVDDFVEGKNTTLQFNPLMADGILYLVTVGQKLVAVEPDTGKELWRFDPHDGSGATGKTRAIVYWEDGDDRRIFYGVANKYLCLDARTGKLVASFADGGRLDLTQNLDHDGIVRRYDTRGPAVIYKDLLILGGSVGEGPRQANPGHIRAFDVRTGERKWIFHTVPHPGEFGYETWSPDSYKYVGGANAWGGLTLDEDRGIVFMGTGSATYDHWGGNRVGDNLFANCVLALDAETGERIWHYQTVRHDLWDYDLPTPPTLITLVKDGEEIDAVAQPSKMGHLFVLDRETGEPIWGVEERPAPVSEIPGEYTAPTQPFPIKPVAYTGQDFTLDDVTDLDPESRAYVLEQLKDFKLGPIFTPPGLEKLVMLPQFNGGSEWPGAAFDASDNTLYINSSNEAEWISMREATVEKEIALPELGERIYQAVCSNCHGLDDGGKLNGVELPALRTVKERLSQEEVMTIITEGKGQMPSWSSFLEIEREALLAFLLDDRKEDLIETENLQFTWTGNIPYLSTGHHDLHDQNGYPINKRPWGQLHAIDMNTGDFKWSVPLGTYPELEAKGHGPTGTFNIGGPVVTAGGVIFIGATLDERFRAFAKETGEELWRYQMDGSGYATPSTFMYKGRQYVVIAGGGGSIHQTPSSDSYYCFALPKE
ncbi:MAG: PQQ-binding-like beta-propeller repeat protein [Verrucomicrobiota bacterium]|nr:PQQ-binding-like beta-propeller repeat protein [Verrucomicrobiota bacterium]